MKVIVHQADKADAETVVELALKNRSGGGVTLYDKTPGVQAPNILNITPDGKIELIAAYRGNLQTNSAGKVLVRNG